MKKTAILVDGGFYQKRAQNVFGDLSPQQRADELEIYCRRHLNIRNINSDGSYSYSKKRFRENFYPSFKFIPPLNA